MWPGISFLLDAWFLRLLGEGQFSILPLRGGLKNKVRTQNPGSRFRLIRLRAHFASCFASHFASHSVSWHFTAITPSLASRILIASRSKAANSSKSRVAPGGQIECYSRFQVKGSIFVLKPRAICNSCSHIWSSLELRLKLIILTPILSQNKGY
jgi:hypothetical protein